MDETSVSREEKRRGEECGRWGGETRGGHARARPRLPALFWSPGWFLIDSGEDRRPLPVGDVDGGRTAVPNGRRGRSVCERVAERPSQPVGGDEECTLD